MAGGIPLPAARSPPRLRCLLSLAASRNSGPLHPPVILLMSGTSREGSPARSQSTTRPRSGEPPAGEPRPRRPLPSLPASLPALKPRFTDGETEARGGEGVPPATGGGARPLVPAPTELGDTWSAAPSASAGTAGPGRGAAVRPGFPRGRRRWRPPPPPPASPAAPAPAVGAAGRPRRLPGLQRGRGAGRGAPRGGGPPAVRPGGWAGGRAGGRAGGGLSPL